jgi:hypothetical protein
MTLREAIEAAVTGGQVTRTRADRFLRILAQQAYTDPDAVQWAGMVADGGERVITLERTVRVEVRITDTDDGADRLTIQRI